MIEIMRPCHITSPTVRDEQNIVAALWKLIILPVVIFKHNVIEESFSIKGLLLANYIKTSPEFSRQALTVDSDSQHPHCMVSRTVNRSWPIAFRALWS